MRRSLIVRTAVEQLDNHQRNAYGTTKWATDYAGRNPVEGVNGMIKDDGSFEKDSCRAFGLAPHTLAAAVIHNLEQTGRTRNPKKSNNIAADHAEQTNPDTTAASPTQRPGQPTPTRAPP